MAFKLDLGRRIAPPRFLAFIAIFVVAAIALPGPLGLGRGTMLAFDIASAAFLLSIAPVFGRSEATQMRRHAKANDANRTELLGLTVVTVVIVLVSVANELHAKGNHVTTGLVIATLVLAWLFTNTVYALHYAHLFYGDDDGDGADDGGLDIPNAKTPDYWDFAYFSFTLGMTFQTSDTQITGARMRRVALGQSMLAFVFNIGVLAFTINVLGGGSS